MELAMYIMHSPASQSGLIQSIGPSEMAVARQRIQTVVIVNKCIPRCIMPVVYLEVRLYGTAQLEFDLLIVCTQRHIALYPLLLHIYYTTRQTFPVY
jgi:hypothetical protein